jgi:hypothetical protein
VSEPPHPRILEISSAPYIKQAFPDSTTFVSARADFTGGSSAAEALSLANMPRVWRLAHQPGLDLIVCNPPFFAPWDPRWLLRAFFNRRVLNGPLPLVSAFGSQLMRGRLAAPLAIIDQEDVPYIARHNFHLLDSCRYYFKRELPIDHWRLFLRTGHRDVPTPRFRGSAHFRRRLEKIRPISIGLPFYAKSQYPDRPQPKKVDVFFSGAISQSSTVRVRGLSELLALRDKGVTIDVPEERLPPAEFLARMAQARLVWSPEGLGWDCFRHYEAAACFSVPVMSRPTIDRHRPLVAGQHAFYYDVEPGGLTQTICAALAEPSRLEAMAAAAQAHVHANHSPRALASYVVETTLAKAPAR